MKLRMYLRGLGLGLVIAALVMTYGAKAENKTMTDAEIRSRAKELGMVDENTTLVSPDNSAPNTSRTEEVEPAVMDEIEVTSEDNSISENAIEEATEEEKALEEEKAAEEEEKKVLEEKKAEEEKKVLEEKKAEEEKKALEEKKAEEEKKALEEKKKAEEEKKALEEKKAEEEKKALEEKKKAEEEKKALEEKKKAEEEKKALEEKKKAEEKKALEEKKEEKNSSPTNKTGYSLTIQKGYSSDRVAKILKEAGVIDNSASFDKYLCDNRYDHRISTGTYNIPAGADYETIAKIITNSK